MRKPFIPLLSAALLLSACAQLNAGSTETIDQVERRRFAAMVAQDVAALEPLLAEELRYVHSNGQRESRAQFLETVRSGRIRYESIDVREIDVRLYDEIGLASGLITVGGRSGGQLLQLELRYTDAYVRRDGRWQLVAWQTTRLPNPQ